MAKKEKDGKRKWYKTLIEVIGMSAWVLIVLYGVQYLLAMMLVRLVGYEWLTGVLGTTVYSALVYALALAVVIWVPQRVRETWRTSREEMGLKDLPTWTDLGLAPVGLVVSLALGVGLVAAMGALFPSIDIAEAQELGGFENLVSLADRLMAFVSLVVIAPIAEELIFRGWLYGKLRAKLSGRFAMITAMLIVSVLFGLVHGQWNVGVTVFAMSLVSCALREITGTAYAGILLHILKNCVAFALMFVFQMV